MMKLTEDQSKLLHDSYGGMCVIGRHENAAIDAAMSLIPQGLLVLEETMEGGGMVVRITDAGRTAINLRGHGHGKPCYYCGEECNSLAGNPSLWPIPLCHPDEPGKVKTHHIGCVMKRLRRLDDLEKMVERLSAILDEGKRDAPAGL